MAGCFCALEWEDCRPPEDPRVPCHVRAQRVLAGGPAEGRCCLAGTTPVTEESGPLQTRAAQGDGSVHFDSSKM